LLIWFSGFILWILFILWFVVTALLKAVFDIPSFHLYNRLGWITIYFLLPMILLIISATAYKLCRYGFKINYKPRYRGIFYNIFIYSIVYIFLLGIYFVLALLFR
jgi:hypothetical protein